MGVNTSVVTQKDVKDVKIGDILWIGGTIELVSSAIQNDRGIYSFTTTSTQNIDTTHRGYNAVLELSETIDPNMLKSVEKLKKILTYKNKRS